MASLQVPGSVSITVLVKLLFALFGSVLAVDAVAVLVMRVPLPLQIRVLTTTVNTDETPEFRIAREQLIVPVLPTPGSEQLHPPGLVNDWNVVVAGIG